MSKLSATQLSALSAVSSEAVYVSNRGKSNRKGVAAPTIASLRSAGLVQPNGASRAVGTRGEALRRLVLTPRGRTALKGV